MLQPTIIATSYGIKVSHGSKEFTFVQEVNYGTQSMATMMRIL